MGQSEYESPLLFLCTVQQLCQAHAILLVFTNFHSELKKIGMREALFFYWWIHWQETLIPEIFKDQTTKKKLVIYSSCMVIITSCC